MIKPQDIRRIFRFVAESLRYTVHSDKQCMQVHLPPQRMHQ